MLSLLLLSVIRFRKGPEAAGGSQALCWNYGSAEAQHWVFVQCKQVPWQELVPFVILAGDGRGRWLWQAPLFPAKLCSVVRGSATLLPLSSSPTVLQAELLAYNLPDVKSLLLLEHTPSGPSTFASQTRGLCLAGRLPLCPGSFPPVRGVCTASLPFLPSSVGLSSALGSGDSILLVFW